MDVDSGESKLFIKVSNSVRMGDNHMLSTAVIKETNNNILTEDIPIIIQIQLTKDTNVRRDAIEDKTNQLKQIAMDRLKKCIDTKALGQTL